MRNLATATMGDVGRLAREGIDPATADRHYQAGRAMQLEEAVAYALNPEALQSRRASSRCSQAQAELECLIRTDHDANGYGRLR
jgi:hypothetical protein